MSVNPAAERTARALAAYIDHSVLRPELTPDEVRQHIATGITLHCRTVCVNPAGLEHAIALTRGTETGVCVVCDFPLGQSQTASKAAQAKALCETGGLDELDVVANIGWIRAHVWDKVTEDLRAVTDACHAYGVLVKVIFETDALLPSEIIGATECAIAAGADFTKTSTGFYTGSKREGGTLEAARQMLDAAKGRIRVKASGGIRTRAHLLSLIDMGVDRIGISYPATAAVLCLAD